MSKSTCEIGSASRPSAARPAVEVPIVNQNDVRSTSRRCSGSDESKVKRKNAGWMPKRSTIESTVVSATSVSIRP